MRRLPPKMYALATIRTGDENDCAVYDAIFPCRGRKDAVERIVDLWRREWPDAEDDGNELPTFTRDHGCPDPECPEQGDCGETSSEWVGLEELTLHRTREDARECMAYYHGRYHVPTPWDRGNR